MKEKTMEKLIELFKEKNSGKKIQLKIRGKSMHSLLKENSVIEIKVTEAKKIKTGDIMVYFSGTQLIAHRFIGRKKGKLLVKGDNNNEFDFLVEKEKVLGKVTKINGKTELIKLNLIKIPLTAISYLNGRLFKALRKIK